jgi:hypothetical protein
MAESLEHEIYDLARAALLDVERLYAQLWSHRDDLSLVHRQLADVLWRSRRRNFSRVQTLHSVFAAGVLLLGVDFVLWGAALTAYD